MSSTSDGSQTQASHKPDFLIVMRGYDRNQVDTYFGQVRAQFDRALEHIRSLEEQIGDLKADQERAQQRLAEQTQELAKITTSAQEQPAAPAKPAKAGSDDLAASFAEVGVRVGAVLQAAEEEARKVREQAHNQAAAIAQEAHQQAEQTRLDELAKTEEQVQQVRAQADEQINALREEHERVVAARLEELDHQAEQIMVDARHHAAQATQAAAEAEQQREQTLAQMREQSTEMIESAQRRAAEQADQIVNQAEQEHERLIREATSRVQAMDEVAQTQQQQRQQIAHRAYELAQQLNEVAAAPIFADAVASFSPQQPEQQPEHQPQHAQQHRHNPFAAATFEPGFVQEDEHEITGSHRAQAVSETSRDEAASDGHSSQLHGFDAAQQASAMEQPSPSFAFADELPASGQAEVPSGWMRDQPQAEGSEADQRTVVYYGNQDGESTQVVPVVTVMPSEQGQHAQPSAFSGWGQTSFASNDFSTSQFEGQPYGSSGWGSAAGEAPGVDEHSSDDQGGQRPQGERG